MIPDKQKLGRRTHILFESRPQTSMQITFLLLGTRGDVQPYLAFALGLKATGHEVTIAAPVNFKELIKPVGLNFHPIPIDLEKIFDSQHGDKILDSDGKVIQLFKILKDITGQVKDIVFQGLLDAAKNAEVIFYTPIAITGYYIGLNLGIPAFPCVTQPLVRTGEYINPLWPGWLGFSRRLNRFSFSLTEQLHWQVQRPFISQWLKANKLSSAPLFGPFKDMFRHKLPFFCAYSSTVVPKPADVGEHIHLTGYWFLDNAHNWQPPKALDDFMKAGKPPICVGFGSMKEANMYRIFEQIVAAIKQLHQRAILLTGWSDIGNSRLAEEKDIFIQKEASHTWLFPRVSAVVHHGGAGTTAAVLRAGKPSVIIPFFFDQTFWGGRVASLGASPKPLNRKKLTVEVLAKAIKTATNDVHIRQSAENLKVQLEEENGVVNAVQELHKILKI